MRFGRIRRLDDGHSSQGAMFCDSLRTLCCLSLLGVNFSRLRRAASESLILALVDL